MLDSASQAPAPPRHAYVHVPFCRHRCGYCNFTLLAGRNDLVPAYLDAIARELGSERDEVETLYFGGGTPTQLATSEFVTLADLVLTRHPLADGYEWTVEANPADIDADYIKLLAQLGVTRLSLGGQSFDSGKLRVLERDHRAADITRGAQAAHAAGLAVSLDLIFGVPGETLDGWRRDLQQAIALGVSHISTYGLTFEKGTQFWNRQQHGTLAQAGEDLERQMYLLAIDTLTSAGFVHYEVSNFAQLGRQSRHNESYWIGRGYWAYGPGAARFLPPVRETNHRSTTTYLARMAAGESPVGESETLTPEQLARERLVFGLRRMAGIDVAAFASETGYAVDALGGKSLVKFVELGLLARDDNNLRLSRAGLLVSDALWPDLL